MTTKTRNATKAKSATNVTTTSAMDVTSSQTAKARQTLEKGRNALASQLSRSRDQALRAGEEVTTRFREGTSKVATTARKVASRAHETTRERVKNMSTGQKVAASAAIGITAAAATALAIRHVAKRRDNDDTTRLRVRAENDEGWRIQVDGKDEEAVFDTKDDALTAARRLAHEKAPSELLIHRHDDSLQDRHHYDA